MTLGNVINQARAYPAKTAILLLQLLIVALVATDIVLLREHRLDAPAEVAQYDDHYSREAAEAADGASSKAGDAKEAAEEAAQAARSAEDAAADAKRAINDIGIFGVRCS